jgi:hypothetical protein
VPIECRRSCWQDSRGSLFVHAPLAEQVVAVEYFCSLWAKQTSWTESESQIANHKHFARRDAASTRADTHVTDMHATGAYQALEAGGPSPTTTLILIRILSETLTVTLNLSITPTSTLTLTLTTSHATPARKTARTRVKSTPGKSRRCSETGRRRSQGCSPMCSRQASFAISGGQPVPLIMAECAVTTCRIVHV